MTFTSYVLDIRYWLFHVFVNVSEYKKAKPYVLIELRLVHTDQC